VAPLEITALLVAFKYHFMVPEEVAVIVAEFPAQIV
jgi:hypothetical protein